MEVKKIPINSIKTKKQVRTKINEKGISELSENIKENGLIQPITIDQDGYVVCGERRLLASKKISEKGEIDCSVVEIDENDTVSRLAMQLSENIHQEALAGYEMAKSLDRLWKEHVKQEKIEERLNANGVDWLSKVTGKSKSWISQLLSLLDEPESIKKELSKSDDKMPFTYVLAANLAPEEHQESLKNKIIDKTIEGVSPIKKVARALKRATSTQAENLLSVNYGVLEEDEIDDTIGIIMRDEEEQKIEEEKLVRQADVTAFTETLLTNIVKKLNGRHLSDIKEESKEKITSLAKQALLTIKEFLS